MNRSLNQRIGWRINQIVEKQRKRKRLKIEIKELALEISRLRKLEKENEM